MVKTEFKTLDEVFELMKDEYRKKNTSVAELKTKIHILNEANMKLENEIGELGTRCHELEQLLKKCRKVISESWTNVTDFSKANIIKKIDEVLK